jgi:hypothetical protein
MLKGEEEPIKLELGLKNQISQQQEPIKSGIEYSSLKMDTRIILVFFEQAADQQNIRLYL